MIGQQQLAPLPEDAINTPLPPPSGSHALISQLGRDCLLSMLMTHGAVDGERRQPATPDPGNLGGVEESKNLPPEDATGGSERSSGVCPAMPSGPRIGFSLLARLATRNDIEAALKDMRPPHLKPDMPLCHASDLRAPKSYEEMMRGQYSKQFLDAMKREVFGLIEAGAFEVVNK